MKTKQIWRVVAALCGLSCWCTPVWVLDQSLLQNARTTVDTSTRAINSGGENWGLHAVGLDLHKVFSGPQGDIGTLVFQPYLLRLQNASKLPPIFKHENDTALQWRIANFNFRADPRGRLNLRVGHFELPFGLEQVEQTNGTLRQTNAGNSAGLKADWGISLNGSLPGFEYEIASMQGSGNQWDYEGRNLWVGRIGTPRDSGKWIGFSALTGEIRANESLLSENLRLNRIAVDVGIDLPLGLQWLAEAANGKQEGQRQSHYFTELNWRSRGENWLAYLQLSAVDHAPASIKTDQQTATFGIKLEPNQRFAFSLETKHHLNAIGNTEKLHQTAMQLRYRL